MRDNDLPGTNAGGEKIEKCLGSDARQYFCQCVIAKFVNAKLVSSACGFIQRAIVRERELAERALPNSKVVCSSLCFVLPGNL